MTNRDASPTALRLTLEGGPANGGSYLVAERGEVVRHAPPRHDARSFARWVKHPVVAVPGTGDAHWCSSTRRATPEEVAAMAVICGVEQPPG